MLAVAAGVAGAAAGLDQSRGINESILILTPFRTLHDLEAHLKSHRLAEMFSRRMKDAPGQLPPGLAYWQPTVGILPAALAAHVTGALRAFSV